MLIEPSSSKKPHRNEDNEVVRVKHIYENCSERFCLGERKFTRQYAHLYAVRLHKMRDSVTEAAKQKWGSDVPVRKLFELNMHEKSIIIGTSFKYMKMKPSILKEISEENHFALQPVRDKYFDEEDYLILEDELQRINLIENIDPQMLVTGIVMAVLGEEDDDGKFIVEDVCFSGIAEQIPRKLIEDDMYVALVSGLGLGNSGESLFPLQLMVDFLAGNLGDENDLHSCAKIVRLIIAGNSLSRSTQNKDFTTKAKYLTRKIPVNTVEAVKTLDDFLEQLVNTMDVDIIPGDYDPSNYLLPQQPLHKCILPKSGNYSTMHNVSNPYECRIQNLRFLGTSGQTLNDIKKYSKLDDPINIMEKTLEWGHLAPTAPDTLSCYPFYDEDPFIVTACPDVYFVGNQPSFETKLFRGQEVTSSLPLQMILYYNIYYFVPWLILNIACISLKFGYLMSLFQKIYLTVFVTSVLIEIARLYVGFIGNMEEKVAELAACWLLTIVQIVALSLLIFYEQFLVLPLERVGNIILLMMALGETVLGYLGVRNIAKKQSVLFHMQQMKEEPEEVAAFKF